MSNKMDLRQKEVQSYVKEIKNCRIELNKANKELNDYLISIGLSTIKHNITDISDETVIDFDNPTDDEVLDMTYIFAKKIKSEDHDLYDIPTLINDRLFLKVIEDKVYHILSESCNTLFINALKNVKIVTEDLSVEEKEKIFGKQ